MKLCTLKQRTKRAQYCRHASRSGLIMLLVLVVVVALSVAVYSFSKHMLLDLAIGQAHAERAQQMLLSESAVEQLLASDKNSLRRLCMPLGDGNLGSATGKTAFRASFQLGLASVKLSARSEETGNMALLVSYPQRHSFQIGLSNQSAKLNLNALAMRKLSRKQVIAKLMKYEGLSAATAEGIANRLGVFDSRANVTIEGMPSALGQRLPSVALRSLVELLTVPGVTEELLLGEDRNANGILDSNENDGDATWPPDNSNGVLDAGWSADWTLMGAESSFRSNGERKINLNQPDLVALYDQLAQFATQEEARFVVAWRISSAIYTDSPTLNAETIRSETENELATTFDDRLAKQLGLDAQSVKGSLEQAPNETSAPQAGLPQPKTRAGLDLSVSSARKLNSVLDLASCQLQLIIDGKDTVLVSPFASDSVSLSRWLTLWEERTCLVEGDENPNRINILQASQATLTTVEGISIELAKAIVAQRANMNRQGAESPRGVGWLLDAGLVTTAELRQIADEITVEGDVFQGYAIGQTSSGHTASIKFVELDARGPSTILRRSIELPPLASVWRLPIGE